MIITAKIVKEGKETEGEVSIKVKKQFSNEFLVLDSQGLGVEAFLLKEVRALISSGVSSLKAFEGAMLVDMDEIKQVIGG